MMWRLVVFVVLIHVITYVPILVLVVFFDIVFLPHFNDPKHADASDSRLILGDTHSADRLRTLAKKMLIENSKMLESIPDWKRKLATR